MSKVKDNSSTSRYDLLGFLLRHRMDLLASLGVFALIWQTIRASSSFFYSDDFRLIRDYDLGFSEVFEVENGHFAPLVRFIYRMLFAVNEGLSFTPFLIMSMLFNIGLFLSWIYLGKSIRLKLPLQVVAMLLILAVPRSGHTVAWLAAAINLLTPSLLFFHLTLVLKSKRISLSWHFLASLSLLGIGGYGIPGLVSVMALYLYVGQIKSALPYAVGLLTAMLVQGSQSSGVSNVPGTDLIGWASKANAELIGKFTPFSGINFGANSWMQIAFFQAIVFVFWKFISGNKSIEKIWGIFPLLAYITFVGLVGISRGEIAPLISSRYIVYTSALLIAFLSWCLSSVSFGNRAWSDFLVLNLVIVVALSIPGRFLDWKQQPLNASYIGKINLDLAKEVLCRDPNKDVSGADGLKYLYESRSSSLWDKWRKVNC